MEDLQKALNEYVELATKAHKLEDEMLDIPKSAAERLGVGLDLLFVADDRNRLFGDRLLGKYKELKEVEKKRDQARNKFMKLLAQ